MFQQITPYILFWRDVLGGHWIKRFLLGQGAFPPQSPHLWATRYIKSTINHIRCRYFLIKCQFWLYFLRKLGFQDNIEVYIYEALF